MPAAKRTIPRTLEKRLYAEADNRCMHCGEANTSALTVHHIVRFTDRPEHHPAHMLVLCATCHALADKGEIPRELLYDIKQKATVEQPKVRAAAAPVVSIAGDGNQVAGRDIKNVRNYYGKRRPAAVLPGSVASDLPKHNYLKYLIDRYNECKRWDFEGRRVEMRYPQVYAAYKREFRCDLKNTPLERFGEAVAFLQKHIDNSKLGRIKKGQGHRLYCSFEDHASAAH